MKKKMYKDVYHKIISVSKVPEASLMPTTWNGQIHTGMVTSIDDNARIKNEAFQ